MQGKNKLIICFLISLFFHTVVLFSLPIKGEENKNYESIFLSLQMLKMSHERDGKESKEKDESKKDKIEKNKESTNKRRVQAENRNKNSEKGRTVVAKKDREIPEHFTKSKIKKTSKKILKKKEEINISENNENVSNRKIQSGIQQKVQPYTLQDTTEEIAMEENFADNYEKEAGNEEEGKNKIINPLNETVSDNYNSGDNGNNDFHSGIGKEVEINSVIDKYRLIVISEINRNKYYPIVAKRMEIEGTVTIGLTIEKNGKLKKVSIVSSSGSKILDRAAIKTTKKCNFPPFPPELSKEKIEFKVKLIYRLLETAE